MELAVPVKVITAVVPEQMVVDPEMVAVGGATTVTVAVPDAGEVQEGVPELATLTRA